MQDIELIHGECLEEMDKLIEQGIKVDMILCDLPYGTTACKWDSIIPFDELWIRYNKIIKDNGAVVLFGSEPFSSRLRMSNIKNYKYDWVWIKERGTGFNFSKYQPLRMNENISVFYSKLNYYNSIGEKLKKPYYHVLPIPKNESSPMTSNGLNEDGTRKYELYTHTKKNNILRFSRDYKNKLHPTQKPVALLEYLIKTYTNENELVLDNCFGSCSTGIACMNTNRRFIGIEKDDNYFNVGKDRVDNHVVLEVSE